MSCFYEDENKYRSLVDELQLKDNIIFMNEFIPDDRVALLMSAADVLVQPYRHATQSGVTPLAYHFEIPMLVTNVGALADTVPDGKVGVVVEPNIVSIGKGIEKLYQNGSSFYIPHIKEEKKKYSWDQMANNFLILHQQL